MNKNQSTLEQTALIQWGRFRQELRQILYEQGIMSNPGWTDEDIIQAFRVQLKKHT